LVENQPAQSENAALPKISNLAYVVPFGRYAGSSEVGPGADEVLVGRAGHRAFFIDLLISSGNRGAFLVTGRRGAGKTSFVHHCISEYEASVFKRFLRHNVGRAFWDRVLVVLFWSVVLLGGLLLSELAQLLAPLANPGPHRMLLWVLLVPIAVVLLFPCVYARAVLEVVFESLTSVEQLKRRGYRRNSVHATVLVLVLIGILWFTPGLSSPAWAASALFTALSALYVGAQALGFQVEREPAHETASKAIPRRLLSVGRRLPRFLLAVGLALATAWTLQVSLTRSARYPVGVTPALENLLETLAINLAAGFCMLAGGFLLRGWYQRRAAFRSFQEAQNEPRKIDQRDPIRQALRRGAVNYALPSLILVSAAVYLATRFDMPPSLLVVPAATVLLVISAGLPIELSIGPKSSTKAIRYRTAPRLSLVAGALISIVVSLQLAQPVVQPLLEHLLEPAPTPAAIRSSGGAASNPSPRVATPGDPSQTPTSLADVPGLVRPAAGEGSFRGWPVFWHRFEALLWLALVLLAFSLLHFIQYEWIIRPHVSAREDGPLDPSGRAPWDDLDSLNRDPARRWRIHRRVAELTLPWSVYRLWLPTAAVSVNLGFDSKLGAGQVIQAMLVGLRDVYHRTFTSWSAGPANIGRMAGALGLVVLVTLAGDTWFRVSTAEEVSHWTRQADSERPHLQGDTSLAGSRGDSSAACAILAASREVRSARLPDLVCRLGEGWFQFLYLDLMPQQLERASRASTQHPRGMGTSSGERLLLYALLPYRDPPRPDDPPLCRPGEVPSAACRWSRLFPPGLHLNLYHVLLFFGFLMAARSAGRRLPLLPYKRNLKRIDDLLDSMTARTRITQRPTLWEPARWIYSLVADRVRETEREPLDPRTMELAFLQILAEVQRGGLRMPGIARKHLNVPAPEITFVFDELDKLGTRLDPEEETGLSSLATELRALQANQERALKLRGLLSDLKNVLSSAPARFIFIGGRNLHDEWLADQTARQPLLTNIFNAEVYLPSLLTDRSRKDRSESGDPTGTSSPLGHRQHHLHTRIDEFALRQYERAEALYKEWALKGFRPSYSLRPTSLGLERFASRVPHQTLAQVLTVFLYSPSVPTEPHRTVEGKALVEDFIAFLALRSMGNPKRLKELLASFIRPVGQEVAPPYRWQLPCRHVLRFRDVEVFRIQLVGSIFRHLAGAFEARMVGRDDKMAISVFFLSDFIFKFHRRAFSWSNLERVDELAHIHRAPDLRGIQEEMVDLFSERFLHRVLNGMYSFRFRSDVAREVEYLSRRSAAEMAALNFTLDESQSLKAIYHDSLERREKREGPTPTLVAGLGELYEFDQEYETARHYYRRAIDLLDEKLCNKSGSADAVRRLLRGEHEGMEDARVFLPWGEARLRLMLQIGMTFEIARSLEHAVTEYRAARTLARALVKACLGLDEEPYAWFRRQAGELPTGRFHTLKHLNILFQPIFAEAWASEKINSTVDTSNQLIETGLWEIRKILPFVNRPRVQPSHDQAEPAHANLALTVSQLHNKAGDLYFFKGRQPVPWARLASSESWAEKGGEDHPTDGYLLRAHYHYAVSLHEIRRYVYHRTESSQHRLSLAKKRTRTLMADALPEFLCRAVASSVSDMAEATLGRVSLFGLLRSPSTKSKGTPGSGLEDEVLTWLGLGDREANQAREWLVDTGSERTESLGDRGNWLGRWRSRSHFKDSKDPLLEFEHPDTPSSRLLVAIHLCRVGARLFERGGYLEDAARELLQVCWIVTRTLWWARTIKTFRDWGAETRQGPFEPAETAIAELEEAVFQGPGTGGWTNATMLHLERFVVDALQEADALFRQSRHHLAAPSSRYQVGNLVPADALTLACSLGLWLESHPWNDPFPTVIEEVRGNLRGLIESWVGAEPTSGFAETLLESMRRQRYPLLNRLNGLQVLVDSSMLSHRIDDPDRQGPPPWGFFRAARLHLEELLDLNEQFAAPLHFTPQQSGTTCALFYLRWRRDASESGVDEAFLRRVFRTAQKKLRASEEMFTLRRGFYESISNLYYPYDDFNDRHIHFKHALQMAGAELTTLLQRLLEVVGPPEGTTRPAP
jgi:hypothetical protein